MPHEYNTAHQLLQAYMFEVVIGMKAFGFKSVDGLKLSAAFEPLAVGGRNDGPVMLRAAVKDSGRLTLERGKYYPDSGKALGFRPGQALPEPMSIEVKHAYGSVGATFKVSRPMLEAIEISGLDASDSSVLVEKLVIAHEGISEG